MLSKSQLVGKNRRRARRAEQEGRQGRPRRSRQRGPRGAEEVRHVPGPRLCKVRRHQEACHQRACRHQSLYQGADGVQGKARPEDCQGPSRKGCQRRGLIFAVCRTTRAAARATSGGFVLPNPLDACSSGFRFTRAAWISSCGRSHATWRPTGDRSGLPERRWRST